MRLVAEALTVARGGTVILEAIGFIVESGGALSVIGPNGAGKSTLLRAVAGLLPPLSGEVRLEGANDDGPPRESMHLLGHLDAVKGGLSVRRNLVFARDALGGEGDVLGALDRVGLGSLEELPGATLSAGQKRRLALARLLCAPRPIWLLDEPTAALDVRGQALLAELVEEHRKVGGMVIAATHADLAFGKGATLDLGQASRSVHAQGDLTLSR
jgi:heme exporter protein A